MALPFQVNFPYNIKLINLKSYIVWMYIVLLVLFLQYDIFIGFLFCGYNN